MAFALFQKKTDYAQMGDPSAQEEYMKKKLGTHEAPMSMNASWQFLRDIAPKVETFKSADREQVYAIGALLSEKFGAKYIHMKEYGKSTMVTQQSAVDKLGPERKDEDSGRAR